MRNPHRRPAVIVLAFLISIASFLFTAATMFSSGSTPHAGPESPSTAIQVGPGTLAFEPNFGQAANDVSYVARGDRSTALLTDDGLVLGTMDPMNGAPGSLSRGIPSSTRWVVTRMAFAGANPGVEVRAEDPMEGVSNYLKGTDPSGWITGVSHFSRVTYRDVYRGVDATYYGNRGGELEFDLSVAAHIDPGVIRLTRAPP